MSGGSQTTIKLYCQGDHLATLVYKKCFYDRKDGWLARFKLAIHQDYCGEAVYAWIRYVSAPIHVRFEPDDSLSFEIRIRHKINDSYHYARETATDLQDYLQKRSREKITFVDSLGIAS